MNKKWRNAGLYALLAIVVIALATAFLDKPSQTRETWKYSKLIQEVENHRVETVRLSADRTRALATIQDGSQVVVNLPNDPQLIGILANNGVDISVLPQSDEGFWFRALSSLFFPVLLLVGLFFLLRRAQNGPGSQAMNFGKSKARVQMEPQTQVTFGDVAGIEQAKLELNEVVDFLKNADRFTAIGAKI
ncbi:MAG TPA: ATP-dependent metallopeptidase FtsH/Yme1/Tma family protein, partial [Cyanophyceae cyanobacterium]